MNPNTQRSLATILALVALSFSIPVSAGKIHDAIDDGKVATVYKIAKADPDVLNSTDKHGWLPIILAAYLGEAGALKVLLKVGDDIERTDEDGKTALHWAAMNPRDRTETIRMLVEQGASVEVTDDNGRTPLHSAATLGHGWNIKQLLAAGSSVSARDSDGLTPLHSLIWKAVAKNARGYPDARDKQMNILLSGGADPNAVTKLNYTPLHYLPGWMKYARDQKMGGSVYHELSGLCQRLASVTDLSIQENKEGWTPLHMAAKHGDRGVVRCLQLSNAPPDIKSKAGKTAFDLAIENGQDEAAGLLAQ